MFYLLGEEERYDVCWCLWWVVYIYSDDFYIGGQCLIVQVDCWVVIEYEIMVGNEDIGDKSLNEGLVVLR